MILSIRNLLTSIDNSREIYSELKTKNRKPNLVYLSEFVKTRQSSNGLNFDAK